MAGLQTAAGVERGRRLVVRAPATMETERLVLRRPVMDDASNVFSRYGSDPAVTRFLGWRPHVSVEESKLLLACCDAEWAQCGVGCYLIQSREDGELIGSVSLRLVSAQQAATGYVLARDAWGRGYATEALHAMRSLALRLGVVRLSAICHPDHRASWRVLQKCGFVREGLLRGHAQFPNIAPGVASDVLSYAFVFETEWQPVVI
jgi:ribosomal-protein-alanine N-acetyltransferase